MELSLKQGERQRLNAVTEDRMREPGNYTLLLQKLEEFRRKFYVNQLIRGLLFSLAVLLGGYLIISVLEYRYYFPPFVRQVMVYGGLVLGGVWLYVWILRPLLHYFRLGKVLDNAEAARLIGAHFPEVQDRLLNILQLRQQAGAESEDALLFASIHQKIEAIRPVPFSLAIDLKGNRKYLKYALPPVLALVFLLFAAPNVLRESNTRLLHSGTYFEREAPFQFNLRSGLLEVVQFEDLAIDLNITGSALPDQVFIVLEGAGDGLFRMQKFEPDAFGYTFHKVPETLRFHFEANGFRSATHTVRVLPAPGLQELEVRLDYPAHTGRKDETLSNQGDLSVPEGTEVTWVIRAENTETVGFRFGDSLWQAERRGKGEFLLSRPVYRDEAYRIGLGNERVSGRDSMAFRLSAIADRHPVIGAERFVDSTNSKFLYFLGEASDDYGLRNLKFVYTRESAEDLSRQGLTEQREEAIPFERGQQRTAFNYNWDISRLGLQPGDRLTYYFEVWDNDGVNGSKSARTASMTYDMATRQEFDQKTQANNREIKDKLQQTLSDIEETREETERLRDRLMQKKEADWEDRQNLQNLMDRRKEIQEQVEDIQETFRENLQDQSDYKKYDEELLKKQEQLQKMFDEVLSEELKKLFEEMERLLEEFSKEQGLEELQEMDLSDEQLENELDRMLDLFKQLELEQKMEDVVDQLEDLSRKQEELSEKAQDLGGSPEDLAKQQEQLNKEFDDLREDLRQMEELNDALSDPNVLPETTDSEEQIEEGMEQSSEQMEQSAGSKQQGKQKQSQQQQQKSAQQMQQNADMMEELAQQLQSALSDMQQQQSAEDLESLRQLLDNLIKLSFDQEALMEELDLVQVNNPRYVELVQEQFNLREDARMVEDSLIALSKRVFEISTYVTRELADMNRHMGLGLDKLGDRQLKEAQSEQQFVMTSLNNLALMLSEVMDQMQQQMANQMAGNQMCQKPGGGKPSNAQMKEMGNLQQQLNQGLQQLKDGQKPGQRNPLNSQQFAQMAARQAAIRQALQQMSQQMNGTREDGDMAKELKEIADQMEKTEEDLVNKVFDNEMLMRQQEIMTRLLEAEEAMRQREMDPKRKSETADEISRELPPSLQEYLKKRQAEIDLFKTVPADLKPYYRELVEQYLNGLEF